MPYCLACGSLVDEYDSGYYSRNMNCIPCYSRKASEVPSVSCSRCGVRIKQFEAKEMQGNYYCNYCYNEKKRVEGLPTCPVCKKKIEYWQKGRQFADGHVVHEECAKKLGGQSQGRDRAVIPVQVKKGGDKTILSSILDRVGGMIG